MDYEIMGPWAQGDPKLEPLRKVAIMYLLFVAERGVFCLLTLIECTCDVLENVYVCSGE